LDGLDVQCREPLRWLPRPRHETVAVLMLTVGSFLPVIGWLVGVRLLWESRTITTRDKLIATLVVPGGPFAALAVSFGFFAGKLRVTCSQGVGGSLDSLTGPATSAVVSPETCTQPALSPWLGIPLVVLLVMASFAGPYEVWRRGRGSSTLPREKAQPDLPRRVVDVGVDQADRLPGAEL
jgi:hypothetical protein